jgi:hypothetical protein
MKTAAMIFSMITLFTVNVLGQKGDVKTLLENRESREDVFNTILNDPNLMTEFMNRMSGNAHAMAMMRGNQTMMQNLQEGYNMNSGHMGSNQGMMGYQGSNTRNGQMGSNQGMMGYGESYNTYHHMGTGYGNMMGMAQGDSVNEGFLQEMGHLMDQCNTDSTICTQLTGVIAQHPDMVRMMMQMMHQEGLPESSPQPKGEQSEQQ